MRQKKMNMKSYIAYILTVSFFATMVMAFGANAVGAAEIKQAVKKTTETKNGKGGTSTTNNQDNQTASIGKPAELKKFDQLAPPSKGDEIAVVKTKLGVIKIRLFSNYAPKAVEIFKNRVNSGYYNGLSFNKLIGNSIVQGGTGTQITSISTSVNSNIDAYNPEIRNYRGAISIASGDSGSIDQFVIVQAGPGKMTKDIISFMKSAGDTQFTKQVVNKYQKVGGAPWLDYHNVIFGQVFAGMDVVDKIAKSAVDENNMLKKEIKITKITIENYKK